MFCFNNMRHEQCGAAGEAPGDWARPATAAAALQALADSALNTEWGR